MHRVVMRGDHLAEIGDARRFARSDQLVRFAAWMSPCTPRTANAHRGICPGRLPRAALATFEAAKCAARRGSRITPTTTGGRSPRQRQDPTLAVERKILRRCYHTLRELGDAAWRCRSRSEGGAISP